MVYLVLVYIVAYRPIVSVLLIPCSGGQLPEASGWLPYRRWRGGKVTTMHALNTWSMVLGKILMLDAALLAK